MDTVVTVTKFFHGLTRGLNYLQNEENFTELDNARAKATEVMKRLLHTHKVRQMFS
jgi:hypothetical protein